MNPFLDTTVAVPEPGARWHRRQSRSSPAFLHRGARTRCVAGTVPAAVSPTVEAPGCRRREGGLSMPTNSAEARVETRRAVRQAGKPVWRHRVPFVFPRFPRSARWLGMVSLVGSVLYPALAFGIDINAASLQQLQEVKGIGPKMAQVILDERERGGRYASMEDVSERVKGIGPKKAAALQAAGLTVGAGSAEVAAPPRSASGGSVKRPR